MAEDHNLIGVVSSGISELDINHRRRLLNSLPSANIALQTLQSQLMHLLS
jgi:hypothetical protein